MSTAAPHRVRRAVAWTTATWFGCGFAPKAPGTAGTLGAIPLYLAISPHGRGWVAFAAFVATAVGIWAASVVARELGRFLRERNIATSRDLVGTLEWPQ